MNAATENALSLSCEFLRNGAFAGLVGDRLPILVPFHPVDGALGGSLCRPAPAGFVTGNAAFGGNPCSPAPAVSATGNASNS